MKSVLCRSFRFHGGASDGALYKNYDTISYNIEVYRSDQYQLAGRRSDHLPSARTFCSSVAFSGITRHYHRNITALGAVFHASNTHDNFYIFVGRSRQ